LHFIENIFSTIVAPMLDHPFYLIFLLYSTLGRLPKKCCNTQDIPPSRLLAADYRSDKNTWYPFFWSFQEVISKNKPSLTGFTGNIAQEILQTLEGIL
jgi:hypothetical protein